MVKIDVNYNNAYKWFHNNNVYTIGHIFYEDKIYEKEELLELISNVRITELKSFLEKTNGFFSIIIENEDKIVLASDLLRTFPIFYQIEENDIIISDNIMNYKDKKLIKDNEEELEASGYVKLGETLFENIFQLESHQIVEINKTDKAVNKEKYFEYKYNTNTAINNWVDYIDSAYDMATKRMISYLKGRKAVIPLSGGKDSRLILCYLKKHGYDNILTYTYGSEINSEIEISKKVAEFYNVDWHFVEYKNESMQKKFNNKEIYEKMANYCGRGYSIPIIQEWEAITQLFSEKLIDKNCVVIPGFIGGFIAGSQITDNLYNKEHADIVDLKNNIWKFHYQYANQSMQNIKNKMVKTLTKNEFDNNTEVVNEYERFIFEERHVKYIMNATRTYDYQGLEWYVIYADKDLIKKWLSVPLEKRYKTALLNELLYTKFKDVMDYAPLYKMNYSKQLKPPFIICKIIYRFIRRYKKGFLNFYGYLYFRTYLKYFIRTKKVDYNRMFAEYYIDYLKQRKDIKKDE